MIEQSGNLTAFYLAILNWIETGDSVFNFDKGMGLCGNTSRFTSKEQARHLTAELQSQLACAGLNEHIPFNDAEEGDIPYSLEHDKFQNPKRLQWIKYHAHI